MTYSIIEERLNKGKTVILDGGIGGELQKLGAKMDKGLWCGRCSIDSPDELLKVHKNYIPFFVFKKTKFIRYLMLLIKKMM